MLTGPVSFMPEVSSSWRGKEGGGMPGGPLGGGLETGIGAPPTIPGIGRIMMVERGLPEAVFGADPPVYMVSGRATRFSGRARRLGSR